MVFQTNMAQEEESINDLLKRATEHFDKDEFAKAIELYTKVLNREQKNVEALKYRGESHRMLGHYVDALKDLSGANTLKPNDDWILSSLGATQYYVGDLEKGIRNLKTSFELVPHICFTLRHLGFAQLLVGNFKAALKNLKKADKLEPNDCWTISKIGIVYRKLGKLQESYNSLKFAIDLNDNEKKENVTIELADTCREMKLFAKAKELLSNLDSPSSVIVNAHIDINLGNLDEARKKLDEIEPKLEHWMVVQHFQTVKKELESDIEF